MIDLDYDHKSVKYLPICRVCDYIDQVEHVSLHWRELLGSKFWLKDFYGLCKIFNLLFLLSFVSLYSCMSFSGNIWSSVPSFL